MIKHFMILSSSYSTGTRIAMHYIIDEQMNPDMLISEVKKIKELCGETVPISTHYVETDSPDWYSVIEKDGLRNALLILVKRMDAKVFSIFKR